MTVERRIRRENHIVESTRRNGLTTQEATHRLFFEREQRTPDAARKVLERLCAEDSLVKFPRYGRLSYYRLGPHSCKKLGLSRKFMRKLGPVRLAYELSALEFALSGLDGPIGAPRKRLSRSALEQYYPGFPAEWMQFAYFHVEGMVFDDDQVPVDQTLLATVRVVNRWKRPEKLIADIRHQVTELTKPNRVFRKLVDAGELGYVVVVASREQEAVLNTALQEVQQEDPLDVPVALFRNEQLLEF